MFVLAPYFLVIFGDALRRGGHDDAAGARASRRSARRSTTGRRMRLRLSSHLPAMVLVQLLSTAVMLGLAGAARAARHRLGRRRLGHRPPGRWRGRLRRQHHRRPLPRRAVSSGARDGRRSRERRLRNLAADGGPRRAAAHPGRALQGGPAVAVGRRLAVSPETEGNGAGDRAGPAAPLPGPRGVAARRPVRRRPRCGDLAEQRHGAGAQGQPRGLWAYLRAEAVLFTHGLYGSPRPVARKPLVNLWHGDGPKDIRPGKGVGALIAQHLPGRQHHRSSRASRPRPSASRRTGCWSPGTPAPTSSGGRPTASGWPSSGSPATSWSGCRRSAGRARSARSGSQADDLATGADGRDRASRAACSTACARAGIQLVVKPHPMDADRRACDGVVTIDRGRPDPRRGRASTRCSGASSGLVTDYSSVWVDYLLLDRPMAFLVPDRDTYTRELFPADVLDWLPGELVEHDQAPFADVPRGPRRREARTAPGSARRSPTRIGLNPTRSSADDLVTALASAGSSGRRHPSGRRSADVRRPQHVAARRGGTAARGAGSWRTVSSDGGAPATAARAPAWAAHATPRAAATARGATGRGCSCAGRPSPATGG